MTGVDRKYDIVMLANGHPVFDTRIFVKEARTLVSAGYSVCIVIPTAHDEERDGVSIIAVRPTNKGWEKLVVNPWNILRKALSQPRSAVYCIHDSDILVAGIVLRLTGRKVVYDAHEDTPLQISYQHWLPRWIRKPYAMFYFALEKVCGWMFNRIIVAEPIITRYFPKKKTHLVRNFPPADAFRSHIQVPYPDRKPRLIHVGSLTAVRGLFEMLDAAAIASTRVKFGFLLGGKFFPPDLESKVIRTYDVSFSGWVSHRDLIAMLFDSQVGIIIPHPLERYKTNYPVKLFEFMAAGLPVIASKEGESAMFVKEADCGILVDPLNIQEIADAITWLFNNPLEAAAMGRRGQQLIFARYNWEIESEVMLRMYEELKPLRL